MTYFKPRLLEFVGAPGLSEGVICALPMQENSGDAFDLVGNMHFTAVGAPGSAAGPNSTNIPRARTFDGTSDYFKHHFSAADVYDVTGDWSFCCWFYMDDISTHRSIAGQTHTWPGGDSAWGSFFDTANNAAGDPDFVLNTTTDGTMGDAISNEFLYDAPTGPVAATWYYIFHARSGTTTYLSINAATSKTTTDTLNDPTEEFVLGATGDYGLKHDGRMAQAVFWDRALSDAEVSILYNSGSGRKLVYQ